MRTRRERPEPARQPAEEGVGPDPARPGDETDDDIDDETGDDPRGGFDAWRRRSAVGELGTAVARGLSAVFAPNENRPVVSAPVPGDPPDPDQGFRVVLDPDDPAKSVAVFNPVAHDEAEVEDDPRPDDA